MLNRTRTSTLDAFGLRDQRNRIYPALTGSDGSTLSLDFTLMSGLDSRFTFSRSSPATFINSSGLVQYADHNILRNSTMLVSTGYTVGTSGGGTATINGDGTVTFSSTAGRVTWLQSVSVAIGLPITFSIEVTALTNTDIRTSDLFAAGFGFTSQVFNYTNSAGVTTTNIGAFTTLPGVGLYTVTAVTTAASANVIFGTDCNGVNRTGTVTITRPQVQYGHVLPRRSFVPNSSTGASFFDTARFDYDPTTLASRGLLIEGSAINIATYSNDFANAIWQVDNGSATNPAVSTVSQSGPDGASTVTRITFNKTGGTFSRIRQTLTGTASTAYTMSVWMKANTANGGASTQNVGIRIGADPAGFNCVVTTTWKRFQYNYTLSGTDAAAQIMLWDNIVGNDETADVLVYGCQIEAGSGASSYIPTGASTVQRAADSCVMTGTNFSSWFAGVTSGYSVLWSCSPQSRQAGSFPPMICLRGPSDSGSRSYYYNDGTYNTAHRTSNGTTASESFGPNSLTYGVARKFAISVTNGSQLVSSNGATANSNTQAITSFNQTTLGFGNDADTTPGSLTGRQHFQSFKFWPYPQTQAALNALTA